MEFVNIFLLISVSQGFIFGFAIIFSPFFKSSINRYLGYSILILAFLMLNVYLDAKAIFVTYPKLKVLYDIEWIFLFPVFFFQYVLKSIRHRLEKSKKLYWLYLPFLFSVLINVVFNLEYAYNWVIFSWNNKDELYDWIFSFQEFGYYGFNLILAIWSYAILKGKKEENYPNNKWLKRLSIWEFSLVVFWIVIDIADMIFKIGYEIGISILCTSASIFIFWVVYHGIYALKLTNHKKYHFSASKKDVANRTYENISTTANNTFSEDNIYFRQLDKLLKNDAIYRDPDMNQEMIAKILNISSGYLSQIVNHITKKNFAAYINAYRVEEAKEMILDNEFNKYSLLSIGLEAGFKSKTTFYTSFKKETGLTPSQFKNQYK